MKIQQLIDNVDDEAIDFFLSSIATDDQGRYLLGRKEIGDVMLAGIYKMLRDLRLNENIKDMKNNGSD